MTMRIVHIALCGVLLAGCGGLRLPEPLKGLPGDWPVFGKTPTRTNATDLIVTPPLTLAWEHDITSGMGTGSPLVIDSVLIVTNLRGELHCINITSGKRIGWAAIGDGVQGSPAIEGSTAYIATANSRESLVAYNLFEGKPLWKKEYGDIEVTPLLLGRRLYFGNTAGMFFCVDKSTGDLEWRFRLPGNTTFKGIRSTATTDGARVFFGAEDGTIYALDATNGAEGWSRTTGAPVFASPALHENILYCGNKNGTLFALNASDGSIIWKFEAGGSIYATPAFTQNLLIIGTTAGTLFGLDRTDGAIQWKQEINSVINSSAAIAGGVAYLGTLKRELLAVNIQDGTVVWKHVLNGRIKTSPAIAHGKVFVATDDKLIHAFKEEQAK